jgi:hypothetical protein
MPTINVSVTRSVHIENTVEVTVVLTKISGCIGRSIEEAREIKLHSSNVNREDGLKRCKTQNPTVRLRRFADMHRLEHVQRTREMLKNGG